MKTYIFTNAEHTVALRSDGASIPWNPEIGGPRSGGQAWREWQDDGAPSPTDYEAPAVDLLAYAARKRWEKEVGGTIWNTYPVHTDRESQSKIIAERLAIAQSERADPGGWKFADGQFRMVSNADFIALTTAVRSHIMACFEAEAYVRAGIGDGTITTTDEIDAAFAA